MDIFEVMAADRAHAQQALGRLGDYLRRSISDAVRDLCRLHGWERVAWRQYLPTYNDGQPVDFVVDRLRGISPDWTEHGNHPSLEAFRYAYPPHLLRLAFGDAAEVSVSKDGEVDVAPVVQAKLEG